MWPVLNESASAAAVVAVVPEVAAVAVTAVVVPQDLTADSPGGCLQYQQANPSNQYQYLPAQLPDPPPWMSALQ